MRLLVAVAVGGAIGSVLRYLAARSLATLGHSFPWATLGVNVLGSMMAGLLYALLVERWGAGTGWRALLMTGLLGGFTTFSAFSLESVRLLQTGREGAALLNIGANLILCLSACAFGLWLVRRMA